MGATQYNPPLNVSSSTGHRDCKSWRVAARAGTDKLRWARLHCQAIAISRSRHPQVLDIDPQLETVLVLELAGNAYPEAGTFSGDDCIHLPLFRELNLTTSQIFKAGNQIDQIE